MEMEHLTRRLAQLGQLGRAALQKNLLGLEVEKLRVAADGSIAMTPHPKILGSALTHPYLTTDFSEALLELITPPHSNILILLKFLTELHLFVDQSLNKEMLWATSMPCLISAVDQIPLAKYGNSHAGIMKTVYRRGLSNRYGRAMQVIAGVHFNYSFSDEFWELTFNQDLFNFLLKFNKNNILMVRNAAQLGMIRNLKRIGWLVPYLFGASPAVDRSFMHAHSHMLQSFDNQTLFLPHATSLRLSDIGYQNKQEKGTGITANYDSLDNYLDSLTWAIETSCPRYEKIGVIVDGRYEQLNTHVLQIENEYYSTVRPKQITQWLEKPILALKKRGIGYVELRSLDVNLYEPLGVGHEQLKFLEILMLYCLLSDSPLIDHREQQAIDENLLQTALHGRTPDLQLIRAQKKITLRAWATELLEQMLAFAEFLDGTANGESSANLALQLAKVADPDLTPSALILAEMRTNHEGFFTLAQRYSEQHQKYFNSLKLSCERQAEFTQLAVTSWKQQYEIEANDHGNFEDFLHAYFAQT